MVSANGSSSVVGYGVAAPLYNKLGFMGTLPLPAGKKNPPPRGYTGSGRPDPEPKQVRQWAKDNANGNLALRLGEVPQQITRTRVDLPAIYAGNPVDGWELIGIDVDDYGAKNGLADLRRLEQGDAEAGEPGLGVLPSTALSTARWDGWNEHRSAIRVFMIPRGFRFMGKAAPDIDIVQKRHRFMLAWPSVNPDANGAQYQWRYGTTDSTLEELEHFEAFGGQPNTGHLRSNGLDGLPDPATDDIAVLPEPWFEYLSRGGMAETEDTISSLTDDQLSDWLQDQGFAPVDDEGNPVICARMRKVLDKHIAALDYSASSHDKLRDAHWELLNSAAEGHDGIKHALDEYHPAWWGHVSENRGGDPETAVAEIDRSLHGALDKIQPMYTRTVEDKDGSTRTEPLGRPSDSCAAREQASAGAFNADQWASNYEDNRIAAGDFGGLGPVVGKLEVLATKPANEYDQSDFGNGEHFIDMYGANVKYVDGRERWVIWDGSQWNYDKSEEMSGLAYRRVAQAQRDYGLAAIMEGRQNDDKEQIAHGKSWLNWGKRSGNIQPITNALISARRLYVDVPGGIAHGQECGLEQVSMSAKVFDSKPDLLGCANGVLELTDDPELRPARKEDYVTFNTGTPYVPWRELANAEGDTLEGWSLWNEYLDMFLPDKDLQRYIQKVMGHLIIGANPEKRLVFLYGPHDTGKSTMLGAIEGALGDYYGTVDISLMKQKDLNPGLIRAVPLRVAGMSEVDAGSMDASTVKRLTGNDMISAEAKYSNEIFTGRPMFTVVIAANNPPTIQNADEALEERILVLPFLKTIERAARNYSRQEDISKHSNVAVLSWLVEGWRMYANEGLGDYPAAVKKLQLEMVAGLNTTQAFIAEMLEKANNSKDGMDAMRQAKGKARARNKTGKPTASDWPEAWCPPAAHLYEVYRRWCNANGVDPVSHPILTKELGLGPTVNRRHGGGKAVKCYIGVRLRDIEIGGRKLKQ